MGTRGQVAALDKSRRDNLVYGRKKASHWRPLYSVKEAIQKAGLT